MRRIVAFLLTAMLSGTGALAAPRKPEPIEIPNGEMTLKGFLYRPEGNGPFPAIVALHACDGLTGRRFPLARRYRDWGERMVGAGFVVVFPDSFGSRSLGPQCNGRDRKLRSGRDRMPDVDAARHWLQSQDWVTHDRISLLGWANGAVAALWTARPRALKEGKPDFRSVVAFYPGCQRLRDTAWSARAPTLVLIGAKDDWASASACEQMVAGARGRSARSVIIVYPNAFHDFDHPNLPLQQRSAVFSTGGTARVHVGTDAVAREDAIKRVRDWLAR